MIQPNVSQKLWILTEKDPVENALSLWAVSQSEISAD
jgi:hypothetical protein